MEVNKNKGIKAGLICFAAFMVPWLFFTWLYSIDLGLRVFIGERGIRFFSGIGIFAIISAFFGFSMATKSNLLKIISSLLVAAVAITWVTLFIYEILTAIS